MNTFRRLSIGMRAKLDEVFTGMENHEALAQSALKDLRNSVAMARVGLTRLRNDEARLRREQADAESRAERWKSRAKAEPQDDRAVECLRRAKQCQRTAELLSTRVLEQQRSAERLGEQVRELETRYSELASRYQLMRTREARARAFESLHTDLAGLGGDVEQVFENWEDRVVRSEVVGGLELELDQELELQYARAEEKSELLLELQQLRGEA